jgi:opacity protein-like surface antigen
MKKIGTTGALLLASNLACASGFYVGAGGGYQTLTNAIGGIGNEISSGTYEYTNDFTAKTEGSGILGTIFVGYNFLFADKFMLGIDLNAEWMNNHIRLYDEGSTIDADVMQLAIVNGLVYNAEDIALGVTVRPGLVLKNNARVYGILGYEAGRIVAEDTFTSYLQGIMDTYHVSSGNRWLNGFRFGVGTQLDVTDRIALRFEINETLYPRTAISPYINVATGGVDSPDSVYSFKLRSTETTLGLVWRFDGPSLAVAQK